MHSPHLFVHSTLLTENHCDQVAILSAIQELKTCLKQTLLQTWIIESIV